MPVFAKPRQKTAKLNFRVLQSSIDLVVKPDEPRSLPEDRSRGTNTTGQEEMKVDFYETKIAPSSVPEASADQMFVMDGTHSEHEQEATA